jgi:hypothetical protein
MASDAKWYPPETHPSFQPALGHQPHRPQLRFFLLSLVIMAAVALTTYVGVLFALAIPPKAACDQVVPGAVRLISVIEAVVPALLALGAVAVCGVVAYRKRFMLVVWFYAFLSVAAVGGLVWWVVVLVHGPAVGQQLFCDIAP